jgi:SAM-dependent methyltransferase
MQRLSRGARRGTSRAVTPAATPPEIFDRTRRRLRRDRAAPGFAGFDFIRAWMLDGIAERLDAVRREFRDVLDLGSFDGAFMPPPGATVTRIDSGARFAAVSGGVQADEDRPHSPEGAYDLVVSAGVLDSVNDLPGALALIRRSLRPDGLFMGAFLGGSTLSTLRSVMLEAEGDRPAARVHPQVDVRAAGDLLVRAEFALPVADVETLEVRYASLFDLVRDLRGMGATSLLRDPAPLNRSAVARAAQAFATRADGEGRTSERFDAIFVTGWAPDPSQPKPARRGSASASLADALRPKP